MSSNSLFLYYDWASNVDGYEVKSEKASRTKYIGTKRLTDFSNKNTNIYAPRRLDARQKQMRCRLQSTVEEINLQTLIKRQNSLVECPQLDR